MAGDAAEREPIPHARCNGGACEDLDGLKADVVCVFKGGDGAAAIKADVEFARQAIKRPVVQNVHMHVVRVGAGVEQLLRINARQR